MAKKWKALLGLRYDTFDQSTSFARTGAPLSCDRAQGPAARWWIERWQGVLMVAALRAGRPLFPGMIGYEDTVVPAIINAVQRRADVVVQKSLAEGFGLTVAERVASQLDKRVLVLEGKRIGNGASGRNGAPKQVLNVARGS